MLTEKKADAHLSSFNEFMDQFEFLIATSKESRARAFALRHKVFREELKYSLGINRIAPYENDIHDEHAIICLLQNKRSGLDVGCLRVVVIENDAQGKLSILPLEESCKESFKNSRLTPEFFPKPKVCEVSRLAVHPDFRKSKDSISGVKENDIELLTQLNEKPRSPLISLGLFLSATAIVGLTGRQHVFAMMEPRFAKLLKLSGLSFEKAGEIVNYHGRRAAFYIDQRVAEEKMKSTLKPFYKKIKDQISLQIIETNEKQRKQH